MNKQFIFGLGLIITGQVFNMPAVQMIGVSLLVIMAFVTLARHLDKNKEQPQKSERKIASGEWLVCRPYSYEEFVSGGNPWYFQRD